MDSQETFVDVLVMLFCGGAVMAFGGLFAWAVWNWTKDVLRGTKR